MTFLKNATGQADDYTTVCLLYYPYLKKYYKIVAKDLSKQKSPQLMLIRKQYSKSNLLEKARDGDANTAMFFIIEKAKEIISDFSQGTVRVF